MNRTTKGLAITLATIALAVGTVSAAPAEPEPDCVPVCEVLNDEAVRQVIAPAAANGRRPPNEPKPRPRTLVVTEDTVDGVLAPSERVELAVSGLDAAHMLVCVADSNTPQEPIMARAAIHPAVFDAEPQHTVQDRVYIWGGWTQAEDETWTFHGSGLDAVRMAVTGRSAEERNFDLAPYVLPLACLTFNADGYLTGYARTELAAGVVFKQYMPGVST